MTEPIFLRVRRVLSANLEEAVDAMERAGGASLMREAIRQVDRARDEVRVEREAAEARGAEATRQQSRLRERAADLDEKARFALAKGREDLAEAALSTQLDAEARAARLDGVQAAAADEAKRLDECLAALGERKAQMEKELAAFELARRESASDAAAPESREQQLKRRVARAEQAFDRVKAGADGPIGPEEAAAAAKIAEIEALRRSALLEERMAALRAASQGG